MKNQRIMRQGLCLAFFCGFSVLRAGDLRITETYNEEKLEERKTMEIGKNYVIIEKDEEFGLSDTLGNEIIPVEYMEIRVEADGVLAARNEIGSVGYITADGKVFVPFQYSEGGDFGGGLAAVGKAKFGVINKKNETVVPLKYDNAAVSVGNDGKPYIYLQSEGKYSRYEIATKKSIATDYAEMTSEREWIILKHRDGRYGLLKGKDEVVPCIFNSAKGARSVMNYLKANGKERADKKEALDILIYMSGDRNKFRVIDIIDSEYWDY